METPILRYLEIPECEGREDRVNAAFDILFEQVAAELGGLCIRRTENGELSLGYGS